MTISDPHKQGRTEDLIKDLLEKISLYIRKKDDSEAATPEKTGEKQDRIKEKLSSVLLSAAGAVKSAFTGMTGRLKEVFSGQGQKKERKKLSIDRFYLLVPIISLSVIALAVLYAGGAFEKRMTRVVVNDNGREVSLLTADQSVGELISNNGFGMREEDKTDIPLTENLSDGMTITIFRSSNATINKNGKIQDVRVLAGTVGDAIEKSGIRIGEHDEIYPSIDTYITEDTSIDIIEVDFEEVQEVVTLYYAEIKEDDPALKKGKTVVVQKGEDGYKERIERVTYKNGQEFDRRVISETVLKEPVNQITKVGTYVEPKATPKPSSIASASAKGSAKATKTAKASSKASSSSKSSSKATQTKKSTATATPKSSSSSSWKTNSSGKLIVVPTVAQIHSSSTLAQHKSAPPPDESIIKETVVLDDVTAYVDTSTSTGAYPRIGTVAADPKRFPYGTKVYVPGYGYGRIEDTGSMRHREETLWDLFMPTESQCKSWGRKHNVKCYILKDS